MHERGADPAAPKDGVQLMGDSMSVSPTSTHYAADTMAPAFPAAIADNNASSGGPVPKRAACTSWDCIAVGLSLSWLQGVIIVVSMSAELEL